MGRKRSFKKGEFFRPLIPTHLAHEVAIGIRNHAVFHDQAGNKFIAAALRDVAKEVENGR